LQIVTAAQRLQKILMEPGIEIMPGCFDAISAKLVGDAAFRVMFMRSCCNAARDVPLIGDGDTGYGNALNVQRTVIEYARAGAAAVMIEDQVSPKRCGHTRGKQVITRDEARMKIRAAVDAKRDVDILILARTDARAVHGFDEALARCRDFEAEGADIIFVEAPRQVRQMEDLFRIPQGGRCATNQVPYNIGDRAIERDLLPWCEQHGMPVMAYSPLGGPGASLLRDSTLAQIGAARGCSAAAVALAWTIRSGNVIAIPESGSPAHVKENAVALALKLTPQELQALNAAHPARRQ
jgi:Phosphoenolpyruvate phosphomutase/Aldo/keto reductase family